MVILRQMRQSESKQSGRGSVCVSFNHHPLSKQAPQRLFTHPSFISYRLSLILHRSIIHSSLCPSLFYHPSIHPPSLTYHPSSTDSSPFHQPSPFLPFCMNLSSVHPSIIPIHTSVSSPSVPPPSPSCTWSSASAEPLPSAQPGSKVRGVPAEQPGRLLPAITHSGQGRRRAACNCTQSQDAWSQRSCESREGKLRDPGSRG